MHTLVLMKDGDRVEIARPESADEAIEAIRAALGRVKGAGCFRLTVEGPAVNLHANVDRQRPVPSPAPPGGPEIRGWHGRNRGRRR